MGSVPSKIVENVYVKQAMAPERITGSDTLYNGATNGSGIDVQDFDDAMVVVDVGEIQGSATLDVAVYENDSDDYSTATLVTGASFTQMTASNDEQLHIGAVDVGATERYLFVRMVPSGATIDVGAQVYLSKGTKERPLTQDNSMPVFDV